MPLNKGFGFAIYALFLLLLISCAPRPDMPPDIVLSESWVRLPPGGRDITGGYLRITNAGGDDVLLSASSPVAEKIEIHQNFETDGLMQMRQMQSVKIAANSEITFAPGGYHLMIFAVQEIKLGQSVQLVLQFENSGAKSVQAVVATTAPDGM
ncbi:Copper metallochaperone PCu(A)C, inserts Cu(I) into cytochrome oxidase subunit II [hydrothermal vent metagenome]|uniref:Copper metallochaperone PCu(A)C, inserts Cu(I) into cytochrome oxidase subunit II n=1 Tax=hydrothermal vent metagenome TaxID=652676 RepID=A0A3B0S4B4_9ZZZZ